MLRLTWTVCSKLDSFRLLTASLKVSPLDNVSSIAKQLVCPASVSCQDSSTWKCQQLHSVNLKYCRIQVPTSAHLNRRTLRVIHQSLQRLLLVLTTHFSSQFLQSLPAVSDQCLSNFSIRLCIFSKSAKLLCVSMFAACLSPCKPSL